MIKTLGALNIKNKTEDNVLRQSLGGSSFHSLSPYVSQFFSDWVCFKPKCTSFSTLDLKNSNLDSQFFACWVYLLAKFASANELTNKFKKRKIWWVWVDLNHRPHPYQGCALTNWATDPISSAFSFICTCSCRSLGHMLYACSLTLSGEQAQLKKKSFEINSLN